LKARLLTAAAAPAGHLALVSLPQRKGQILAIQEDRVLAFGAMSEKRLPIFAVSSLGFVAVVLFGFWLALQLAD